MDELRHVHHNLWRAVSRDVGMDNVEERPVERTAISYQDYKDAADDGTVMESIEPFTRDSSESVEKCGVVYEHTVEGLALFVQNLPRPIRYSYYKELQKGWHVYDPHTEFARMGIPDALWRLSDINSDYELCSTYPSVVAVPATIDDHCLSLASLFRSRGRFPALSWRHATNYCSLTRSSQPLVGLGQNRSTYDEQLIRAINQASAVAGVGETVNLTTNHRMLPGRKTARQVSTNERGDVVHPLVIIDARPKINAQANQAAGKGYEMGKAYEDCHVLFMGIANIHAMRKSVDSLDEACSNSLGDDSNWLKNVDGSGWLQHISRVLVASSRIVHCITKEAYSVLVHCSDGWDRTAQLTSLSMLMMDPFFRTYEGFQVLVEKEWFSFGHKFCDRLGWRDAGWGDDERSPVFHQFLDCVYQCVRQNPNIFEFNDELLLFLANHVLSGWFGNVFANCEKDRIELKRTSLSIWTYVRLERERFSNVTFVPYNDVWVPSSSAKNIVVWDGWFLNWHNTLMEMGWIRKNEDFSDLHESPSEWMADSEVERCCHCDQRFDFIHRRHHCRACGQIFCESCVKSTRIVRTVSETNPVRVCFDCVLLIDEDTQKSGDDNETADAGRSHKESTSSLLGRLRTGRKSNFTIDNEKFEIESSGAPHNHMDSVKSVSTLTTIGTQGDRDSACTWNGESSSPSLMNRVGMMIKAKSTTNMKPGERGVVEGPSKESTHSEVDLSSYPTERIAAVKLRDPNRHPEAADEGIVQKHRPFCEDDATDILRGDDMGSGDVLEEEDVDDDMSVNSSSSEKRVYFALEENTSVEPTAYPSEAPPGKHRSAQSYDGRDGRNGRTVKCSARARTYSHSPLDGRYSSRGGHRESRRKKGSSKSPPRHSKAEQSASNQRDSLKKSHSGRYDAFTKPVNLSVGARPRRSSGN